MNKTISLLSILIIILFSGCKSMNGRYIHEDDMLYPKERMYGRQDHYIYEDKFGSVKLPKEIPFKDYKWANPFSYRLGLVKDSDSTLKYIDKNGHTVIDVSAYNMCWSFGAYITPTSRGFQGLAYVCKVEGESWVGPGLTYLEDEDFKENDTKFGLINLKGQVVLPVEYDAILGRMGDDELYDKIWWVRKDGLYGAINEKAKFIIPLKFKFVHFFEHGSALVHYNGFWGLIDKKGKTLFPFSITEFNQSGTVNYYPRIIAKKDGYWGIINEKGKVLIPFIYARYEEPYQWADPQGGKIIFYREDGSTMIWNIKEDRQME